MDDVREMLDHFQIRKVLVAYCRGSDRVDEALMRGIYAQDSWDDHGVIAAPGPEYASDMCRLIHETSDILSHILGQSTIAIDGDGAGAETYFLATSVDRSAAGQRMCNQLGGRFVDRMIREDGQWQVKHRIVVRDWSVAIPITHDWEASRTLKPGQRGQADPSYAVLGAVFNGGDEANA